VITFSRILNRSSSYKSTTYVGVGTSNFFLILKISNSTGIFVYMSVATLLIYSSRFIPPPDPPSDVCISSVFYQSIFTELLKYEISAFECKPNTLGLVKSGILSISISKSSFVTASYGIV